MSLDFLVYYVWHVEYSRACERMAVRKTATAAYLKKNAINYSLPYLYDLFYSYYVKYKIML